VPGSGTISGSVSAYGFNKWSGIKEI
jgi:hypothetical protein